MASSSVDISMLMNVSFFVRWGSESYRLNLARGCTVNQAKLELTDYVKMPIHEMVLTFEGKQLKNTRTLSDYNIQEEGSVLFLSRDRKAFFIYFSFFEFVYFFKKC